MKPERCTCSPGDGSDECPDYDACFDAYLEAQHDARQAFKAKLRTIGFARVKGGAREDSRP